MSDPQGIVMLLIAPDGDVDAHVADFARDGYGGYSVREAQEYRCRRRLAREVFDRFCAPVIRDSVDDYHQEQTIQRMVREHSYRVHTIAIGHSDEDAA